MAFESRKQGGGVKTSKHERRNEKCSNRYVAIVSVARNILERKNSSPFFVFSRVTYGVIH